MGSSRFEVRRLPDGVLLGLLVALHLAAAGLALGVWNPESEVTPFWPPTGIAIAATAIFGRRAAVLCGLSACLVSYAFTESAIFAVGVFLANTVEAAIAGTYFRRATSGRFSLSVPQDAGALLLAGCLGAFAAAIIGGAFDWLAFRWDAPHFGVRLAAWFFGDIAGLVLFAPMVLSFIAPAPLAKPRAKGLGFTVATASLMGLALSIAFFPFPDPPFGLSFALLQLAAIVTVSFRFGTRGAHFSAALIGVVSYFGALVSRGPFDFGAATPSMSVIWGAMMLFGGTGLFVASILAEHFDAELRVSEGERRLRALFEHAPNGMALVGADWRIALANPEARKLAGKEEIEGVTMEDAFPPDEASVVIQALRRGEARGERIAQSRISRKTGDSALELVVRTSLLGEDSRFEGAVVVIEDVTKREQERRDREEMEQQLGAAQRLESIGKLAGGIAHDFNNMLQAIRASLELTELFAKKGKDVVPHVERALAATDRATALTKQLLAFSRRQPASFERVDLVATLRSEMTLLERLLPEDIRLVFDPGEDDAWVRGDHAQLEQVVLNLVVNARDAMPNGGELRIALETHRFDESDSGMVRLLVTDEGPGVDPSIRDRIFEPFFTTKATGRGTGLGLAVVYGVVKAHGGSVHVEAAPARGSRFVVELPWMRKPEDEVDASEPEGEAPEGHGEHILLVEDDNLVRNAVREMLVASGYRVTVAGNGAEAVVAFKESTSAFDVVLLDVVMPVMGGREAYELLRAIDPTIAVVFATGYSEEQIDVRFVLRERVPVVTKPYQRAALLSAITQVILAKRMADSDVSSAP